MINLIESVFIVLVPNSYEAYFFQELPPYTIKTKVWLVDTNLSLDGLFYDLICDPFSNVIGLRYWLFDVSYTEHSIFQRYQHDKRFIYRAELSALDIIFEIENLDGYANGLYAVKTIQDFDAELVLICGSELALMWKITKYIECEK
jgi:hypothetical protein